MGICALDISLSKNTIIEIKATAHKNGKTSVVGATLVGIPLPPDENPEDMPSDGDNSGDGTTENPDVTPVPDSNTIDPARMEWHAKSYFKDAAYEGVGS